MAAASAWGLYWIPLRHFEAAGLAPGWASLAQFTVATTVLLPVALWRGWQGRPTGLGHFWTGLLLGGAFALYAYSLLLTEVARALILFYVTPVWSTILEVIVMGRRFTGRRAISLVLGLAGLVFVLSAKSGIPLPRNLGDLIAILSGVVWACGSVRLRIEQGVGVFENLFSFFLFGGAFAFVVAMLPLGAVNRAPPLETLWPMLPWLLSVGLFFLVPVTWAMLWGSQRMDPARAGILLQLEAIVGVASAALLTNEPFGVSEFLGTCLVIASGIVDVTIRRQMGNVTST